MSRPVVIGGGIVGAATAWRLAERGRSPILFDRQDDGRATDAGAGISYVPSTSRTDPASLALSVRANHTYQDLAAELRATLGRADVGVSPRPVYKIAFEGEAAALERIRAWLAEAIDSQEELDDEDVHPVDAATIDDAMPALVETIGGVRFANGLQIHGKRITDAMREAAQAAGASIHEDDVRRIDVAGGRVRGVVTADRGTVETDQAVITGGAWSGRFADDVGTDLPVTPQRGQIVHLADVGAVTDDWPMVSTLEGHYLVPWPNGRVAVGATHEDAGFDARVTVDGVARMLEHAVSLVPSLADATVEEVRVGLRPRSADGAPVLGEIPDIEGAYVATGHGGGGLQRGPLSGRLVADLMCGDTPAIDLDPFTPDRFEASS